ncbi:MAG: hypothetical protein AAGF12_01940 [Myxococcota bacterium]
MRLLLLSPLILTVACNSIFTDLRPDESNPPSPSPEAGTPDSAIAPDSAVVADSSASPDGGMSPDGEVPDAEPPPADGVLSRGTWEGRTGYRASGSVELRRVGGVLELAFLEDFSTQGVPGPVVMLSTREAIGNSIDPAAGDIELEPLASRSGAQTYVVPPEGANARFAWVYCRPFRVEVARAPLMEVSQ